MLEPLNRYEDHMVNRLEQAVELVDTVGLPSVRVLADTYHMNIEEDEPTPALVKAAARLGHVQVSDSNRFQPGAGHIDWAALLGTLDAIGYDGHLAAGVPAARRAGRRGRRDPRLPAPARRMTVDRVTTVSEPVPPPGVVRRDRRTSTGRPGACWSPTGGGAPPCPPPALYPHQWSWDSAFIAIGLRHLSPARAQRELESLFGAQWARRPGAAHRVRPVGAGRRVLPRPVVLALRGRARTRRPCRRPGSCSRRRTRSPRG